MADHNRLFGLPLNLSPMFEDIESFCEDVKEWLKQDDENIAVIHCKAGKGRTGLMICCWLLYNGDWEDADGALKYYAAYRTCNQKVHLKNN